MDVISFCSFSAFFEVCWRSQRGIHGQIDVSGTMGLWLSMKLIEMWMVSLCEIWKYNQEPWVSKSWSRHGNTRAASHPMSILDFISGELSGPGSHDHTAWWINELVQTMLEVVFKKNYPKKKITNVILYDIMIYSHHLPYSSATTNGIFQALEPLDLPWRPVTHAACRRKRV